MFLCCCFLLHCVIFPPDVSMLLFSVILYHFPADVSVLLFFRLQTLGGMQASDELDDGQVRQLLFDLESSYNEFNNILHNA